MKSQFPNKPYIRKLGTIECNNIVETTPVVFRDRLYRFEVVRRKSFCADNADSVKHWTELKDDPCLRFIDVRTNTATPIFAEGHTFGFPFVEDDVMYVVTGASPTWGSDRLLFYRSTDLVNWEQYSEFYLPGWRIYNMNIAKKGDEYILLIEIDLPLEERGPVNYTFRFAKSKDLTNWEMTPFECAFHRNNSYAGSPAIYTLDGDDHFYVGYLEYLPYGRWANCLARSKDLINWEHSPLNPVLMFDPYEDKKIASPFLTPADRERIEKAYDINNSDMELCEFLGRTIIYYSWGDQMGTEFLAEACYEGSMKDFLQGFFENKD